MIALPVSSTAQVLRPYQREALDAVNTSWAEGQTPLIWAATGAGKTTIFSQLLVETVDPAFQRGLVFAHTKEIIEQTATRIANQYGELLQPYYGPRFAPGIGVVMGEKDSPDARVIVATRQSLHPKRLARVLSNDPFDVVVIDEGHHVSPDNTYHDIIKMLRQANPNVKLVGFSATPKRTDKKGLGIIFTSIPFRWTILDGILGGYLAPATRLKIKTGVDTSGVKSQAGDYNEKQLISVLDASNWVSLAIDAFNEHAGERQTLAFFPKVDMSREFARRLSEAGIPAAHIDANTDKGERGDVLRRYQRGEIRVVSNRGVLTEGFDAPQTSAILMARPTRSETLFTQIIGRGLRLYPGKTDCLIIDLTVVDTKVLEVGTILGQMADCATCGTQFWKGLKRCPQCGADADSAVPNTKTCPHCGEEIARNARVCPHCGYIIPIVVLPPDFKGHGEGLQAEVAALFHNMSSAWYGDPDGTFSCSAGFDGAAMVILPPTFAGNDSRLKERIQRGYALLRDIDQGKCDPDIREALLDQIAMLERELHRIDQYSLYYVPPELKDPLTKKPLPNQLPVRYVRVNADLASLMQEADSEANRYGGLATDKSASWRSDLASDGQRYLLRSLGAKKLPKELTKGEAGTLLTHIKSTRRVRSFVAEDSLTEPMEA